MAKKERATEVRMTTEAVANNPAKKRTTRCFSSTFLSLLNNTKLEFILVMVSTSVTCLLPTAFPTPYRPPVKKAGTNT